ncbi:MAG: hypothetical protein QOF71_3030 [Candidatus Eremiobacteraeota bacterium]|jgi:hypothetical protein|nr:hypothetical protein [Candidatus Eremiobacteraeota bacterium]
MRLARFVILFAALWCSLADRAFAGEDGTLRITVAAEGSKAAVPLSQVDIYGPRSLRGAAGADGVVVFDKIDPGTYVIVVSHSRYISQTLRGITVAAGKEAAVSVLLARPPRERPLWLRRIGIVAAKPQPKSSTTQATSDNPEAKLSGSVVAALGALPSITIQNEGPIKSVSIGGHPASDTLVSIEGVPVSALGGAPDLHPFTLDLFNGVSVSRATPNGTAAGTINFDTRNPTLDWIGTGSAIEGAYGNAGTTFSETGTLGRLGVAFTHASRAEGNPLDGQRFLDLSGLSYVHRAVAQTSGEALKLRYPFSINNILVASLVSVNSDVPLFCAELTGPLPCGYGPVNAQRRSVSSVQLRDVVAAGRLSASVALFHNVSTLDVDQTGLYVNGVNVPQRSTGTTLANGFIATGQLQLGKSFPLSFNVSNNSQTTTSAGAAFGSFIAPTLSSVTYTNASISAPLVRSRRFSSDLTLGAQRAGRQSHTTEELSVKYSPTSADNVTLLAGTGFVSAQPGSFSGVADPSSLQFDCVNGNASGFGPSSGSTNGTNSRASLTWTHVGRRISATVTARNEVDFNAPITAIVNGAALNPGLLSPAYLAEVGRDYSAACGPSAAVPGAGKLFFQVTGAVPRVVYTGGEGNVHIDASRNVAFDLSYGTEIARAFGSDGLIFARGSTVVAGRQMPNHPIHSANASTAVAVGRSRATALANLHYVSANNFNNLPSYAVVDAGIEFKLERGSIATISLLNLTNAHGGTFATPAGAVPLSTLTGAFPTIATPLTPRSLNLRLRIPFGPGSALEGLPLADLGPGSYGYKLFPYPSARPADPFAVDRRTGLCGPETAPRAKRSLSLLQAYVERIEPVRSVSGAYPQSFATQTVEGLQISYRRTPTSYAVLVSIDPNLSFTERLPVIKPITGCARLYSGELRETRERALYISSYDEQQALRPIVFFAPSVGLYVPPPLIENAPLFPGYAKVPPVAPETPFAITTGAECPSYVRSSAEAFVALIRPYVAAFYDRHEKPQPPDGFTITAHADGGNAWLEIDSRDVDVTLLASCLTVAGVDRGTLLRLTLGGTPPPTIDYAPRLGLYNMLY